ncbi:hypothetical protein [Qipengyuania sp. ASV99]|uniref:hypothetical protein n=1 Tax=Qipengyuania sp. ASV99 TaxID=3399681 RepID=UPI003A4C7989
MRVSSYTCLPQITRYANPWAEETDAMEIPPLLLQTAGSLAAILALYGLARALRLGGQAGLRDEAAVRQAAQEIEDGFDAQRISIARAENAALAKDPAGRIMVIKRHGNRFAGRVLTPAAQTREEVDALVVDCGERSFGPVRMSINDSAAWADAIARL